MVKKMYFQKPGRNLENLEKNSKKHMATLIYPNFTSFNILKRAYKTSSLLLKKENLLKLICEVFKKEVKKYFLKLSCVSFIFTIFFVDFIHDCQQVCKVISSNFLKTVNKNE